jgi:pyruvate/2-oxoglutarate/acetoin dehydrogenase E1 component
VSDLCQADGIHINLFGLHTMTGAGFYHCQQNNSFKKYVFGLKTVLSQEKTHTNNLVISMLMIHGQLIYTHHMHVYHTSSIVKQAKQPVFFPLNTSASNQQSGNKHMTVARSCR